MNRFCLLAATSSFFLAAPFVPAEDYTLHSFKKIQLSEHFWSEGATFGDFNRDGKMDIVSGPYWYEGPDFQKRHEYYPAKQTFSAKKADGTTEKLPGFEGSLGVNNTYSDNFFAFVRDFNGDGWPDILIVGFPGRDAAWFENPQGKEEPWKRHLIFDKVDNESPWFTDMDGDGKPEIVCNSGGFFGYIKQEANDPTQPWKFHPISPKGGWGQFTHGLGVGDVNGDGKLDIIEAGGWWEQPASLAGDPVWTKHAANFGGGAQFYVYDVNGDGLPDVIGSQNAHGYGLAWHEQVRDGGQITFKTHVFMREKPEENRYGVSFGELHAVAMADMDGDGLPDIITGTRFWSHGKHGNAKLDSTAPLYWFKQVRHGSEIDFIPHLIDDNSGVGTQVVAGDVNGDGLPDVVVGNKKGTFVLLHEKKSVSKEEWEKAQPKLLYPDAGKSSAPSAQKPAANAVSPAPSAPAGVQPVGLLPTNKDGRALNLDFEEGTLRDWTATGNAFEKQPIKGETVAARRGDMWSNHTGQYWIGTYEILGDDAQGTLTSAPFKVTQPWASFLVGAGPYETTRVELVRADTKEVFFKTSGFDQEEFKKTNNASEIMHRVVVDLQPNRGQEIFVRVVDDQTGHWGHINFDDFKLYEKKPVFAAPAAPVAQKPPEANPLTADTVKYAGLTPEKAATAMTLPTGFAAKLFAGEPDVKQPISFAQDDRGRLWVAEAYTYPQRAPEGKGKDRILVFEDTDGDGHFDKSTVFMEGLNLVSGLEVGFGGVWVGAAPNLMFIPIADGDEPKPAGPPQILLDGWGYGDTHETLNTFTWGPDGWLYGCHGVFTQSNVGKPGASKTERTLLTAGVWRYHPTKHVFEVFAEGTSNPWGIDFDEHGQCFIEACVIPHLWHMIQGGRYQRQGGEHTNPYTYDDIKTIADHVHWLGDRGPHAGNGRSDTAGGGHAHAGLMCYLGASWPEKYHGQLFMNNIHGARINVDAPERHGSGFVGHHTPDFILFNDTWSQILNLRYDQDGSVYMIDWYDKQQCHTGDAKAHDRSNGRIFKIVYNAQKTTPVNLQKLSSAELVKLQLQPNDWWVRHAREVLQERGPDPKVHAALWKILNNDREAMHKLHALWALHVTGGLSEEQALPLLKNTDEYIRAWTLQFLCEDSKPSDAAIKAFAELARTEPSPVVRVYLASAAQRIGIEKRWDLVAALNSRSEDAGDQNLPLMAWYASEPLSVADPNRALTLAMNSKLPRVLSFAARRVASLGTPDARHAIATSLLSATSDPQQADLLNGLSTALKGQRSAPLPADWERVEEKLGASPNREIRAAVQSLSLTFGSSVARTNARKTLGDSPAGVEDRTHALETLLNVKDPTLPPLLQQLLADSKLRGAALRGLAAYADPKTPDAVLAIYKDLNAADKRDALLTLSSRAPYATALLAAMARGDVPAKDLSADIARQLRGLGQADLTAQLEKLWGVSRESAADKLQEVARYKKLVENPQPTPNASQGRGIFSRTCQQCHTLFDVGGKIGPDITGSNRADLDYLLHNIIDPNAEIPNLYRTSTMELKDERNITGIVTQQDDKTVTVVSPNETLIIPRSDIKSLRLSEVSMMPEGLLTPLKNNEIRDLISYLRSPTQVPLPPEPAK